MLGGGLNSWDVLFLSSVSDPLIHACLLSFIHLIQSPASLFSSETRLKDNWCRIWSFPGLCLTDNTVRHQHKSQIILRLWWNQGKDCQDRCWDGFFSAIITSNDEDAVADLQKSSAIFLSFWHSVTVVALVCVSHDFSDSPKEQQISDHFCSTAEEH